MARPSLPPGPLTVLRGHKEAINCVGFLSEDALSSGSLDGNVHVWDLQSRRTVHQWNAHNNTSVLSLSPIFLQQSLITCGRDGFVRLWDVATIQAGVPDAIVSLHTGSPHFCNASSDRNQQEPHLVVTPSSVESDILLWDLRSGQRIVSISPPALSSVGNTSNNGRGMLTSVLLQSSSLTPNTTSPLNSGSLRETEPVVEEGTTSQSSSITIVAGYEDGSISCYDARMFKSLCDLKLHDEPIMALDMSPNCKHIVTGGASRRITRCRFRIPTVESKVSVAENVITNSVHTVFATIPAVKEAVTLEVLESHELPVEGTFLPYSRHEILIHKYPHSNNTLEFMSSFVAYVSFVIQSLACFLTHLFTYSLTY